MNFYVLNIANCCIENLVLLWLFASFSTKKPIKINFLFTYVLLTVCSFVFTYVDSFLFSILPLNFCLVFCCFFLTHRYLSARERFWNTLIAYLLLIYFQVIFVCIFPDKYVGTHTGNFLVNGTTLFCAILFSLLSKRLGLQKYYTSHRTTFRIFFIALCLPEFITVQFFVSLLSSAPKLIMLCLLLLQFLYVSLLVVIFLIFIRKQEQLQYNTTKQHIDHLNQALDDAKRTAHDFNKHIRYLQNTITIHLEQQQYSQLQENIDDYCNSLLQRNRKDEILLHLDDPILRALLYGRKTEAKSKNIDFHLDANTTLLPSFPLDNHQIVEVFDNLMDNAFECAETLSNHRWIRVVLTCQKTDSGKFQNVFCVQNPYENLDFAAVTSEKNFSSKGVSHKGVGLKTVAKIVSETQGQLILSDENNIFTAKIVYWD